MGDCSKDLFSTAGAGRTDLTPFPKTFFMKGLLTSRGYHIDFFIGLVTNETNGTNTAGGWGSLYLCPLLLLQCITGNVLFIVVARPSELFAYVTVLDFLQKLVHTKFPISQEDLYKEREDEYCTEHDKDMQYFGWVW
jgi:hypothetical protein